MIMLTILQVRSRISIVVTVLTKCNFPTIASSKSVPKWLRQQPTTGNSNMAAQTYPVWAAILLLPVVGRCQNHAGMLSLNSHGWKPKICCWNFNAIYHSSGLGGHIAICGGFFDPKHNTCASKYKRNTRVNNLLHQLIYISQYIKH